MLAKQLLEVGFHGEARNHLVAVGVGVNQGSISVERTTDQQTGFVAAPQDDLEELAEDSNAVAVADAGQAGMVGQRLVEVIAEIPAHADAVGGDELELASRADTLEELDQMELEEDDGVNRGAAEGGVALTHQISDKAQVKRALQMPVEMVGGHQVVERDAFLRGKDSSFDSSSPVS